MTSLAAAFEAGDYRLGRAYLYRAKQMFVRSGGDWTAAHDDTLRMCVRNVERGIGTPKRAKAYKAEDLDLRSTGAGRC